MIRKGEGEGWGCIALPTRPRRYCNPALRVFLISSSVVISSDAKSIRNLSSHLPLFQGQLHSPAENHVNITGIFFLCSNLLLILLLLVLLLLVLLLLVDGRKILCSEKKTLKETCFWQALGKYQARYHDDFIAKKKCQNLQTAILSLVVVWKLYFLQIYA